MDRLVIKSESVERYIGDDNLRNKMAEKAYNVVVNNHTFSHRFKRMFDILKSEGIK